MRPLLVLPAFLLTSAALIAQQPAQSSGMTTAPSFPTPVVRGPVIVLAPSAGVGCPVSLQALKTPQGAALKQTDRNGSTPSLALNIILRALGNKPIQQARVTLTGIAGGHLLPAASDTTGDSSEDFTLTSGTSPKAQLESIVYTKHLTGIRTVSLTEITWADGTSWHAAAGSACRITPSLYLAVNATNSR